MCQTIQWKCNPCLSVYLSSLCLLQYQSYRVEDKCIRRRRAATATWLEKEALGPWGSPRRLESPWCCSSPAAVGMHWCATVPPAAGFWTYLLLVFSQVFLLLLPPVPVRLPTPQSRCSAAESLSELTQQLRAQHHPWTSPPVSSFPHQSPVGKEEADPLSTVIPLHPSLSSVEPPPPSPSPTACIRPSGPWITTRKINN